MFGRKNANKSTAAAPNQPAAAAPRRWYQFRRSTWAGGIFALAVFWYLQYSEPIGGKDKWKDRIGYDFYSFYGTYLGWPIRAGVVERCRFDEPIDFGWPPLVAKVLMLGKLPQAINLVVGVFMIASTAWCSERFFRLRQWRLATLLQLFVVIALVLTFMKYEERWARATLDRGHSIHDDKSLLWGPRLMIETWPVKVVVLTPVACLATTCVTLVTRGLSRFVPRRSDGTRQPSGNRRPSED